MLMARPCRATSNALRNWARVTKTATSIRPIASTNCEITMATMSRRWIEVLTFSSPQHISLTAKGVNEFCVVIFELAAQPGDVNLDHVAESFPVEVVQVLEQFGLGDHRAGTMREIFHRGQRDHLALSSYRKISGVDLDIRYFQHSRALALSAPDQRLGPRQQFAEIKRLGDVVIGSGIEQRYDRLLLVTGGQD